MSERNIGHFYIRFLFIVWCKDCDGIVDEQLTCTSRAADVHLSCTSQAADVHLTGSWRAPHVLLTCTARGARVYLARNRRLTLQPRKPKQCTCACVRYWCPPKKFRTMTTIELKLHMARKFPRQKADGRDVDRHLADEHLTERTMHRTDIWPKKNVSQILIN